MSIKNRTGSNTDRIKVRVGGETPKFVQSSTQKKSQVDPNKRKY